MKRTILITGATGHLGKEVVHALHADGNTILGTYHNQEPDEFLKQKITQSERVDLHLETETNAVIFKLLQQYPDLDTAVLLTGGFTPGSIAETDESLLDLQFSLNFKTAWFVVKPLMEHFLKIGRGQFIFIAARPAISPEAGKNFVAYALSKSLVFSLAEIINADGKTSGITASVIVPSILDTPQNRKEMPNADFSKWVNTTEVAETIRFILSPAGRQMRQPVYKIYNKS
jgi:NAD(P)-dependent dehydrogenase (short-subunit alcohol dehydrogenase family)